jgi:hypothetical protein
MPAFKPNDIFAGRYMLSERMGEENSSELWKAKDPLADDAAVVLKIYTPEIGLADGGMRRFRRKFFFSQQLSHHHLLKVFHFDVFDGYPYLVMQKGEQILLSFLFLKLCSF